MDPALDKNNRSNIETTRTYVTGLDITTETTTLDDPQRPNGLYYFLSGSAIAIVYALVHMMFLQGSSPLLNRQFLVPLVFIVTLGLAANYTGHKANEFLTKCWAVHKQNELLKEAFVKAQKMHVASNKAKLKEYEGLRKTENESRLASYRVHRDILTSFVGVLDRLVKRYKKAPTVKVKGKAAKNNDDDLTALLQGFDVGLRADVDIAQKVLAVAEKIEVVLQQEGLSLDEPNRLIAEAKEGLPDEQDDMAPRMSSLDPDAPRIILPDLHAPTTASLSEGLSGKLDEHYAKLDKYFMSLKDSPVLEE
jgi:hypothetical protein